MPISQVSNCDSDGPLPGLRFPCSASLPWVLSQDSDPQAALQQRFVPDPRALTHVFDLPLPELHCFSSVPCPLVPELGLGPTMLLHLAHWARNTAFHLVIQEPMPLLCPASRTWITSASPIDQESNPTVDLSTLALQTVAVVYPCSRTKELLQFCKYLGLGPWLCCCSRVPVCQICPWEGLNQLEFLFKGKNGE